jgi:hypothetical protein
LAVNAPPPWRGRRSGHGPEGGEKKRQSFDHGVQIDQDVDGREPDHAIPLRIEPERPIAVLDHPVAVKFAIDLHDQLCCWAVEVHDVRPDRDLTAEPRSEAAAPDFAPEQAFCQSHVAAELAGAFEHRRSVCEGRLVRKLTR